MGYAQKVLNPKSDGYVGPERRSSGRHCLCAYCGKEIRGGSITRDHVHPRHRGGTVTVPCCKKCNHFKGGDTLDQFAERLATMLVNVKKVEKLIEAKPTI